MKISILISTLSSGGAERNASLLANNLSIKGHKVNIITFQKKNSKPFYNISNDVKIINLDLLRISENPIKKIINFLKRIKILKLELNSQKSDIVISFLETMNLTMLFATMSLNHNTLKIISDRNNPKKTENFTLIFLLKLLLYRYSDILVVQTKKIIENYKYINKKKIKIISNFLIENIEEKKNYILGRKIKILAIGRLENQKGYDILLNSLADLKKNVYFKCDIYGKGSKLKIIQKLIKKLNLQTSVNLKGTSNMINKIYKNYDIFILASKFEGYPNTLLEAMSCGLASISSDCDYGPKEIIVNKKNGILFKNCDFKDLTKKILFLINNKYLFKKFSDYNKKKYNFKKINKKVFKKWEKILTIK